MEKICSIDGCGLCVRNKGLCNKHYLKLLRHGDPLVQKRRPPGSVTEEDRRRWRKEDYAKHKDGYIKRAKRWREENPEQYKKNKTEYLARDEVKIAARERTKKWSQENRERKRASDKRWIDNNRPIVRSHKAKRRAKERQATPPWLTPEQIEAIKAVYIEADRLTKETGIPHQVDHIVPLSGKVVSGLHVPWNLRAIPAVENNRRPRIWSENSAA